MTKIATKWGETINGKLNSLPHSPKYCETIPNVGNKPENPLPEDAADDEGAADDGASASMDGANQLVLVQSRRGQGVTIGRAHGPVDI